MAKGNTVRVAWKTSQRVRAAIAAGEKQAEFFGLTEIQKLNAALSVFRSLTKAENIARESRAPAYAPVAPPARTEAGTVNYRKVA